MKETTFRILETHINNQGENYTTRERLRILDTAAELIEETKQKMPPLKRFLLSKWRLPTYTWVISWIIGFIIGMYM